MLTLTWQIPQTPRSDQPCKMQSFVPTYRTNTSDALIWRQVYFDNCYKVPELQATDVVIDIGAHTGSFTCACLRKGSRKILAFEPDPESFALASQNVRHFEKCAEIFDLDSETF